MTATSSESTNQKMNALVDPIDALYSALRDDGFDHESALKTLLWLVQTCANYAVTRREATAD